MQLGKGKVAMQRRDGGSELRNTKAAAAARR
jgi:hypothetical protein